VKRDGLSGLKLFDIVCRPTHSLPPGKIGESSIECEQPALTLVNLNAIRSCSILNRAMANGAFRFCCIHLQLLNHWYAGSR
jgi:hypothetical protein